MTEAHLHTPRMAEITKLALEHRVELARAIQEFEVQCDFLTLHGATTTPIEAYFLLAFLTKLYIDGAKYGEAGRRVAPVGEFTACPVPVSELRKMLRSPRKLARFDLILPQQRLGVYTADFVVQRATYHIIGNPEDDSVREVLAVSRPVVVECDGHDYHDTTKEQAVHDRKRDRYMQSQGFYIARFTGSELYRDPFAAAAEVHKVLDDEATWTIHPLKEDAEGGNG